MSLINIAPDGKLSPAWDVTWCIPNRQPHVKGNGIKKYLVRFKKGEKWVKETQLEF